MSEALLRTAAAWFPEEYGDEIMPADRAHPNDWIVAKGGEYFLAPAEGKDADATQLLRDGDIVPFIARTDYGGATFTAHADGTFDIDRPMPEGAENVIAFGDSDTLSQSIEELAENLKTFDERSEGQYDLSYYTFSDAVMFEFRAAAFHLVEAAKVQ